LSTMSRKGYHGFPTVTDRLRDHMSSLKQEISGACDGAPLRPSMLAWEGRCHRSVGEAAIDHEADDRHRYTRQPREPRLMRRLECDIR
jgi:hypothetical protein